MVIDLIFTLENTLDLAFLLSYLQFKLQKKLAQVCPTTTFWSTCPHGLLRHY